MKTVNACQSCSLRQAGAIASLVCYPCRERDQHSHYCIAIEDEGRLHPCLASEDEGSVRHYLTKLAAEGQRAVTLTWSSELHCYRTR